jgi:uncharacterized protein (TIGR00288 family)
MLNNKKTIALFIDADNAPAAKIGIILSELASYGVVNIRRAYANWTKPCVKPWEEVLNEFAIQPIQQFDFTKGKNATDIALVIDAMDTPYTKDIDSLCLVSSDCDFTPLVTRARADGKFVIGFGESKAPRAFINSCSTFLFLDDEPTENKITSKRNQCIKPKIGVIRILRKAINAAKKENGWAHLGPVGQHISNHASFDQKKYGFKKISDLFASIDVFEMKKTSSKGILVRDKPTKPDN